jgi:hypothetical protein
VEWELARKPKYSEETCPSATLSTTNPTRLELGAAVESRRLTGSPAHSRRYTD